MADEGGGGAENVEDRENVDKMDVWSYIEVTDDSDSEVTDARARS